MQNPCNILGIPQLSRKRLILEITERLRCAKLWCLRFWSVLCNPDLRCRSKFQLYKFFVRPILTYGCELWDLDKCNSHKLQRFEISLLVEIYKSKYPQRHPNRLKPNIRTVYTKFGTSNVVDHIKNERLCWSKLLKEEELALRRRRRRRPCVHFWDHPRQIRLPPEETMDRPRPVQKKV
ncbi:hypothetical protein PYW08_003216 [Mythimna loreyi]|uniref:Uncharacterized protein n=1 Tax=Mythimna loreyi TaxID=667449 RepID=A0ACC2QQK0_9NEOP|nr:hypothetical protein PYW08_003216 [Mythimna loreyi]